MSNIVKYLLMGMCVAMIGFIDMQQSSDFGSFVGAFST